MPDVQSRSRPPSFFPWSARLVNGAYHLGLGWLLGHRLIRITHRGRKTGRLRTSIAEVVHYDPSSGESIVFAGWEGRTDWYRNLQATAALSVETGGARYAPHQRFLTEGEVERTLVKYVRQHRWAARLLLGLLVGGRVNVDSDDDLRRAARFFRGVAFRPERHPTSRR